jgi:hypothetical protein
MPVRRQRLLCTRCVALPAFWRFERLVGERGGPLLDAELPAVAVVAGDDLGEALVQPVDVARADSAR